MYREREGEGERSSDLRDSDTLDRTDKDAVQCYANTPMQQEKAYNHEIDANGRMDINAIAIGPPTREINPNMDSTDQISGIPTRGTTQQRQTPCCKT